MNFSKFERLGIGRFCEIRKAVHYGTGSFEREIVVKRLLPGEKDKEESVRSLEIEAAILSRLHHPKIVSPIDFIKDSEGTALVLEYLAGADFRRLQDKAKYVTPRVLATLAVQMGLALQAIHEAKDYSGKPLGIVHRDFGLGNLILTVDGEIKVLDFGSATSRAFPQPASESLFRGRAGTLPPEAFGSGAVDGRLDLFSLGVMLYRLATGAIVFRSESDAEAREQVLRAEVGPPSKLNRDYGRRENDLILTCLEKDPRQRFASAGEFVVAARIVADKRDGLLSGPELAAYFAAVD